MTTSPAALQKPSRYRLRLFAAFVILFIISSTAYLILDAAFPRTDDTLTRFFDIEIPEPQYETVLLWTAWFGAKTWFFNSLGSSPFRGCQYSLCLLANNKTLINSSSMVLFHVRDMSELMMPAKRFADQNWVFMSMESPMNTAIPKRRQFEKVFNMTMTYMQSSDIVINYGATERVNIMPPQRQDYAAKKDKSILWLVSNCHSPGTKHRNEFVRELRRFIDVDVYGHCGEKDPCTSNMTASAKCLSELKKRYRFYLALENSLCKDYITEKFWDALNDDMVPIVMGASLDEYRQVAPPTSFIHVSQFQTTEQLANYLLYLSQNQSAYNQYMAWKSSYKILKKPYRKQEVACKLCELAHLRPSRPGLDLRQLWKKEELCRSSWHDS